VVEGRAAMSKPKPSKSLRRKKKIEAQRAELKTYIQYSYGQSGWEELMRIEAQVRKRKQATDHRRAEMKELLITITIVGLALLAGVGGSGSACLLLGATAVRF
jgi:hypothetical protein